ncbi:MAG: helix-turn-helix domain-containing protein [Chitinophagales bacterium]
MNANKVIVTTETELDLLIQNSIRKVFSENRNQQVESSYNDILTLTEACEYLNLAKQTLYGFTSKNEIPFIKRGKKLYFKKSDLEKWLMVGKQLTKEEIIEHGFEGLTKIKNNRNGK